MVVISLLNQTTLYIAGLSTTIAVQNFLSTDRVRATVRDARTKKLSAGTERSGRVYGHPTVIVGAGPTSTVDLSSAASMAPLLASSGNKLGTSSPQLFPRPPAYTTGVIFGRTEHEVHNSTNKQSRSCHSRRTVSIGSIESTTVWMVTWRRLLALAVLRVVMIHRMFGPTHQNFISSSFLAFERSRGGGTVDDAGFRGNDKVSVNYGDEGDAHENGQPIRRDSKVPKHLDTKSSVNSASSSGQFTDILEKWRPPGRSSRWRMKGRIPKLLGCTDR